MKKFIMLCALLFSAQWSLACDPLGSGLQLSTSHSQGDIKDDRNAAPESGSNIPQATDDGTAVASFTSRPDGHAPIGVMGDHVHDKGELMLSYRYMSMWMKDMMEGTNTVTSSEVLSSTGFMMAPDKMTMQMHMIGAMYGLSDHVTLMAMVPCLINDMSMMRKMQGDEIEMRSSGIGDVSLTGMLLITKDEHQRFQGNLGVFFPTGSIDEEKNGTRMGYPMQTGSGSYALQPALAYTRYWRSCSFGSQVFMKYYLAGNSAGYERATEYQVNAWGAYRLTGNLSASVRLSFQENGPIKDGDPMINPMMSPVNRPDLQGGNTLYSFVGVNWLGTTFLRGHRFALEVGLPVDQDLNGPQMKHMLVGTIGWQKVF